MPLNKQFVSARIAKKNEHAFVLTIRYCWYFVLEYEEVFVEDNLELCKSRLLRERSHDHVTYFSDDGKEGTLI